MENYQNNELKKDIKDSLTCFICFGEIRSPLMCKNCKRLACKECVQKSFEVNNQCAYCRAKMTINEMISIPLMNNISNFFLKQIENEEKNPKPKKDETEINKFANKINNKTTILKKKNNPIFLRNNSAKKKVQQESICLNHNEYLKYICLDCNQKFCSKCLIVTNIESKKHEGHLIIPLEKYSKYKLEEMLNISSKLSDKKKELIDINDSIISKMKICNKEEEVINDLFDRAKDLALSNIQNKKTILNIKNNEINSAIEEINNISNSKDILKKYIEKNNWIGINEYHDKLNELKNIDKYKLNDENENLINNNHKIYQTDFVYIEINKNDKKLLGEREIEINNKTHIIQIIPDEEEGLNIRFVIKNGINKKYFVYSIFQKDIENINVIKLDGGINEDNNFALFKYISRNEFMSFVDYTNKCKMKFIIFEFE